MKQTFKRTTSMVNEKKAEEAMRNAGFRIYKYHDSIARTVTFIDMMDETHLRIANEIFDRIG